MTSDRVRFTALPLAASREEYDYASSELEARLLELPGVLSVYRTGSVTVPGISDIDRVVVVEPNGLLPPIWAKLSPRTRYLALHAPFVVDTETFARHRWFAGLEPLELVSGDPVAIEERPTPAFSELLLAAEGLTVGLLKLAKLQTTRRAKVRPMLCELNNLRRDLALAGIGRTAAPLAWDVVDAVASIRGDWWTLSQLERVARIQRLLARAGPGFESALSTLGSRCEGGASVETLRLEGPWSNVRLIGSDERISRLRPFPIPAASAAHVPRLAEARWRFGRHELAMPRNVVRLLSGQSGPVPFIEERRELVCRYRDFAARNAPSFSRIGHVTAFPL